MTSTPEPIEPKLTASQQRILAEVRAVGERRYNGRAYKPIKALVAARLVTADFDMRLTSKGNGIQPVWVITVRPTPGTTAQETP